MPTMDDIHMYPLIRNSHIKKSVMRGNGEVLFILAVEQYNRSPTKKKAIAIYNIFLRPRADPYAPGLSAGDLGADHAAMRWLAATIEWYEDLRGQALAMNPIKRIMSSSLRPAMPGIFDVIVATVTRGAALDGHNAPLSDALREVPVATDNIFRGFYALAMDVKAQLHQAGFNTSQLGLDGFGMFLEQVGRTTRGEAVDPTRDLTGRRI